MRSVLCWTHRSRYRCTVALSGQWAVEGAEGQTGESLQRAAEGAQSSALPGSEPGGTRAKRDCWVRAAPRGSAEIPELGAN